ncbi:hypothetical protein [Pseudoalteromonas denitrificans]|uniref:Uncharacterized protein n=1 Tax=Pseudoalteromonas denitrificans DSM 6059 TaxID=1123010 RepID=A0A1I1GJ31_9GAMM|nr:hypothetical protein [Pseudoalteromonas denitrificans]SFC11787.1 hypothetical protein SAMN02745724_00923 [Pseudoalteromonas denitrificans DSM 6059]
MEAIFIKSEGEYLQATIEIDGVELHAMDDFGGENCTAGEKIEIDISAGLFYEDEEWESIFSGNLEQKMGIEHLIGWSYRVYGRVIDITPEVIVDAGAIKLEVPIDTHDPKVVGEFVAFTITRLDAYAR